MLGHFHCCDIHNTSVFTQKVQSVAGKIRTVQTGVVPLGS